MKRLPLIPAGFDVELKRLEMKKSSVDVPSGKIKKTDLLNEIEDLKNKLTAIKYENQELELEIDKYKTQLAWHIRYEKRLIDLLKDSDSNAVIPGKKPLKDQVNRSIDELSDDEINQLIEENRKPRTGSEL
jgi:regulator of replication initiation timing